MNLFRLDTTSLARDNAVAEAIDLFEQAREQYGPTLEGADRIPGFSTKVAPYVRREGRRTRLDLDALKGDL